MEVINSTPNGQIFTCSCRNSIKIEFGNLFLNLNNNEFNQLVTYVNSIDFEGWLEHNRNSSNRRKLLLHIGERNAFFALNRSEFIEFKELLSLKSMSGFVSFSEIMVEKINLN